MFSSFNQAIRRWLLICVSSSSMMVAEEAVPAISGPAIAKEEKIVLFDGKSLGKWKPVDFYGAGKVEVKNGVLQVSAGSELSGVVWKGSVPRTAHYSIELEARRTDGDDFLLGLTLPVGKKHCTWVCGGWGGKLVGISSIDTLDANENETGELMDFEKGKWYRFKIQVEPKRLQCWIDGKRVIDVALEDRLIGIRAGGLEPCLPLGIATYQTTAEYRKIVWKNLVMKKEVPAGP